MHERTPDTNVPDVPPSPDEDDAEIDEDTGDEDDDLEEYAEDVNEPASEE
ncbi:MAG TPA: hypothetical protein VMF61_09325 [Candidatus Acidoferrales bacterium]|nr:hypothetical protein [Candidatus Acidoferrales bacterium]